MTAPALRSAAGFVGRNLLQGDIKSGLPVAIACSNRQKFTEKFL